VFTVHAQPRNGNKSNTSGNAHQRRGGIIGRVTQTVRNAINRVRGGNTATTRTQRGRG